MLNEKEIEVMEHALGLQRAWDTYGYHYKRHGKQYLKSYRNYFQTQEDDRPYYKIWKELQEKGFANSWIESNLGKDYPYFEVSDKGISELEKQQNYSIKFI